MDFEYRTMNETQIQTSIDRYFRSASEKLVSAKAVKAYADTYVGASFNPYALLAPNEVAFSRILADLLDPKGSHAQGDKFLNLFIEIFNKDFKRETKNHSVNVKCETSTDKSRRIDILIEFGNNIAIAIENKPWAKEQNNQLDDYAYYLINRYDKFYLLFLYGSSIEQRTLSAHKKELDIINSFHEIPIIGREKSISNWVRNCAQNSTSKKVQLYLEDFYEWIEGVC